MIVPDSYLPTLIAYDYNFFAFPDGRSDLATTTPPIHCIKFVSLEENSRVLVKIDTDEMDP